MKVLVCGGRKYENRKRVYDVLHDFEEHTEITLLIEGGAPGADTLAKEWARLNGIHVAEVKADWTSWGMKAGAMRNTAMLLLNPEHVIAFPGGTGTADMVRKARKAGIPVTEVVDEPSIS
jgi:hypothetical protein